MIDAVTIPDDCPTCERRLFVSQHLAPRPRWQWRARLLLLLGICISGILAVLTLVCAGAIVAALTQGQEMGRRDRHDWGMVAVLLWSVSEALALLPALALAALAARLPRVLPLRCRACGWSETYILPRRDRLATIADR